MAYKFERLEVWQLAIEYVDTIYSLAEKLPRNEEYNLKPKIVRAATSIALNVTGQTDSEQARFLGMAVRSLIKTVACQHLIRRRDYLANDAILGDAYLKSQTLARKLQSFRKSLTPHQIREGGTDYTLEDV
jgi:four helix bundle protein